VDFPMRCFPNRRAAVLSSRPPLERRLPAEAEWSHWFGSSIKENIAYFSKLSSVQRNDAAGSLPCTLRFPTCERIKRIDGPRTREHSGMISFPQN
jgi:hypothetical protein